MAEPTEWRRKRRRQRYSFAVGSIAHGWVLMERGHIYYSIFLLNLVLDLFKGIQNSKEYLFFFPNPVFAASLF